MFQSDMSEEWRLYCWKNEAARWSYMRDRYTVDQRYNAIRVSEVRWYEQHVLQGEMIEDYDGRCE